MGRTIRQAVAPIVAVTMFMFTPPGLSQTSPQSTSAPSLSSLIVTDGAIPDIRLPRPLSRNEEAALRPMDRFRECIHCPEMVVVPAGNFTMGASATESGSTPDERPQHQVIFAHPFAVGRSPVTFDEWNTCVSAGGCRYSPSDRNAAAGTQPVTNILWDDAKEYVYWLSRTTGRTYRLLSEAEREYVTRAGTTTAFWWGDSFTPLEARASGKDPHPVVEAGGRKTVPIPSFAVNPWGLYGVHGPVYDWVEDCWNDSYDGAPSDGSAWLTGNCSARILRGGAFSRSEQTRRSAARIWSGPPNRLAYMSIRVARSLAVQEHMIPARTSTCSKGC
jgi:formylglycine-generating enzyme required for sulfatase activity